MSGINTTALIVFTFNVMVVMGVPIECDALFVSLMLGQSVRLLRVCEDLCLSSLNAVLLGIVVTHH